jgi:preprotein translocase subunit SecE
MEEVLPALQQAPDAQGVQIVADAVAKVPTPGVVSRVRSYFTDVSAEMRRVTWPDAGQVKQLSIGVVIISLLVGAIIALIDLGLQSVLIKGIPALFRGGA